MKFFTTFLTVGLSWALTIAATAQNVTIPDANFKAFLVGNANINTNGDTEIQVAEATAFVGTINCGNQNIADLTGIEAFVNLLQLHCFNNQLTSLNVTQNTRLTQLYCNNNQLTALDVTQNVNLATLHCNNNQLTSLDVTQNTLLRFLRCHQNQLTALDVTQNTALVLLYCQLNQLTALDMSQSGNLATLYCSSNQLTSLDVTQNTSLGILHCNSNQLTTLNLPSGTSLSILYCQFNQLTALDVSQSSGLGWLYCYSNQIATLDVTQNAGLVRLYCYGNPLSTLDLSQNSSLNRLQCQGMFLISLNVKNGNNSNFTQFDARSNPNLTCIEVDDSTYSATNWTNVDPTATFSTNCALLYTTELPSLTGVQMYPNPTTDQLHLDFGESHQQIQVQVVNITGQAVRTQTFANQAQATLSLGTLAKGTYFIHLQTKKGTAIFKVYKQ